MVNKNQSFPNYREILRCLDYCNKNYDFKLTQEQMKRIAQDAFAKLGKVLQQRRKTELYESASYFVGNRKVSAINFEVMFNCSSLICYFRIQQRQMVTYESNWKKIKSIIPKYPP